MEEKEGRASEADVKKRLKVPFEEMARASGQNTREMTAKKFSPFNEAAAKQSLEWRKEAEDELRKVIKEYPGKEVSPEPLPASFLSRPHSRLVPACR